MLIGLLKVINDEDSGLLAAIGLAIGGAIGTSIIVSGLAAAMGIYGIPIGALISVGLLGLAVSALYGVEIKRSFLIAGIFIALHVTIIIALATMQAS
ncbi:hypothetical protein DTL42_04620 [Bremerella cremea]|uniref:Uncharacterized protein n=1 Tax=Bremerella cremea TaxID=1031537 RepID=A0A368KVT3_9BACT|nr:hypothetical protein DTL42_04620 [Bremerella cremea]